MVAKGNADKHRYTYSKGVKAVEEQKWGRNKAVERYGELRDPDMKPPDGACYPQKLGDKNNLQDKGYSNEVPENSWLRGGGKGGEGYPNFDRGKRR